jgi:PTS system ascorbate-specific IIA component
MPGLLIIAHSPLASALRSVAAHVYPEAMPGVVAVDVLPEWSTEELEAVVRAGLKAVADPEALVLIDVFGATPCNVALRIAEGQDVRVLSGVNVPMLWRALSHLSEPLETLAALALVGGSKGVMTVGLARPQTQGQLGKLNDQSPPHHQQ